MIPFEYEFLFHPITYLKERYSLSFKRRQLRETASTIKKGIETMKEDTLKNHSVLFSIIAEKDRLKDTIKIHQGDS